MNVYMPQENILLLVMYINDMRKVLCLWDDNNFADYSYIFNAAMMEW